MKNAMMFPGLRDYGMTEAQYREGLKARFMTRVQKSAHPKGCWLWIGGTGKGAGGSYGAFAHALEGGKPKSDTAHRAAWLLFKTGLLKRGVVIRHACGIPLCVKPEHLIAQRKRPAGLCAACEHKILPPKGAR